MPSISRRQFGLALAGSLALIPLAGCSTGDAGTTSSPAPSPAASGATDSFPVTITHKFGTTTIPAAPSKVVAAGYNEQDFVLAFGLTPVAVREFLGYDAPKRPWAPDGVRGTALATVGSQDLDLEKIASLQPDLIMAVNAYIDEKTYQLLTAIAPTVAQSADFADGGTPWAEQTRLTGQALGRSAQATTLVDQVTALFTAAKTEHPAFAGKTAAFALGSTAAGIFSLGTEDYRTGWLTDLGFTVEGEGTEGAVSWERLDLVDKDVLLAEGVTAPDQQRAVWQELAVVKEGRTVLLGDFDEDFAAALGFNSPLSLPFVLQTAVPRLADATDGDPATTPSPYPG